MQNSTGNAEAVSFTVSGKDFVRARKNLKPAYPKKKQLMTTTIGVVADSTDEISLQLPGAVVRLPAIVSEPFTLQMPWIFFEQLTTAKFDDTAMIRFQVCSGLFKYGEMAIKSDQIVFSKQTIAKHQQIASSDGEINVDEQTQKTMVEWPILELMEAPLGLPLVGAYAYMRKYGFREFIENHGFVANQREVVSILRKASDLLKPLGIRREDIEAIIDNRFGISGDYPVDGSRWTDVSWPRWSLLRARIKHKRLIVSARDKVTEFFGTGVT